MKMVPNYPADHPSSKMEVNIIGMSSDDLLRKIASISIEFDGMDDARVTKVSYRNGETASFRSGKSTVWTYPVCSSCQRKHPVKYMSCQEAEREDYPF